MIPNTLLDLTGSLAGFARFDAYTVSSGEVKKGICRLEAGFYGSEGYRSVRSMERSGFDMKQIGSLSDVEWPAAFRRCFTEDLSKGVPFLTSSGMMEARPRSERLLSRRNTANLDLYVMKAEMILVSRSGTVGNVVLATKDHEAFALTDDAIRVFTPTDMLGPIYCFLQSAPGQFLLKKSSSGSVVTHLYEDDVAQLNVPLLPKLLREHLTELVQHAAELRAQANQLLDRADDMVYRQNYIEPPTNTVQSSLQAMIVPASRLRTWYEGKERLRFEATFQAPEGLRCADLVRRGTWKRLGDIADIPFTGPGSLPGVHKVEKQHGTPLVTGRDLRRARPVPSYYVASARKRLLDAMIPKRGTTLVLCAGTLGPTDFVGDAYAGWCVSLDVIRVTPKPAGISPGYIYAFLSSRLGQAQMCRHTYGSVIPRIHSRQVAEIAVPIPKDSGAETGEVVERAFAHRNEAVLMENQGIETFMHAVQSGRRAIEAEWGGEY